MAINENKQINLQDLGYDKFFESGFEQSNSDGLTAARIIAEYKELYRAKNANGEFLARITGKQIFNAHSRQDYPAVGDWVAIEELPEGQAVIHAIMPRKTMIKRRVAGKNDIQVIGANIDEAFIVQALDADYSLNRFERYLAITNDGGVMPVVILNKADLVNQEELEAKITGIKERFGNVGLITSSALAAGGMDALKAYIKPGKTYCFLGSSGVGKSTMINKLIGKEIIKIGDIDQKTERGKHTTTTREMYLLENGGVVIDNPGMREVGMADSASGVDETFDPILALAKKCKFGDCTHTQEPGCAVLAAVESGGLDISQYSNYIGLKKESEFFEMTKVQRREKDKQFGKFLKSVKKQLKKLDY